ncbi:MAG: ribonuclease H-like domain-containing protein [Chthonomonadales bacterium]
MLDNTFIHCPGIGEKTERKIWESGVRTWQDVENGSPLPISELSHSLLLPIVQESIARLNAGDYKWFADKLPLREHWRTLQHFRDRIVYLDIETTGGTGPDDVTVIGVYDGLTCDQFVAGRDLHLFEKYMSDRALIVTFFGTGFDIPMLKRAFGMEFSQLHIDLCFVLKRLGYKGGLKSIEQQLGMDRSDETSGLGGWDAVRLWNLWQSGNEDALEILLRYNKEDVVNMEYLLEFAYAKMLAAVGSAEIS